MVQSCYSCSFLSTSVGPLLWLRRDCLNSPEQQIHCYRIMRTGLGKQDTRAIGLVLQSVQMVHGVYAAVTVIIFMYFLLQKSFFLVTRCCSFSKKGTRLSSKKNLPLFHKSVFPIYLHRRHLKFYMSTPHKILYWRTWPKLRQRF